MADPSHLTQRPKRPENAEHGENTEHIVNRILSIFKPVLTSPTIDSRSSIRDQLRAINPPPSILAATINIFAKLISVTPATREATVPARQSCLCDLVTHLFANNFLSEAILYDALDADSASILLPDGKWRSDNLRIRTRMWYTQTRFNLFREESEGYAKVILLLWDCTLSPCEPTKVFETLLALIGHFSLDTNRIIEVVLSAAAEKVHESITRTGGPFVHRIPQPFAHILDQFPLDHIYAVIGAMLRTYQDHVVPDGEPTAEVHSNESDTKTSASLVALVSVMISEGRMKVSDVLGYLSPMDNAEFTTRFVQYEREVADLAERVTGARLSTQPSGDDLKSPRPKHGASDRDVFSQYRLIERGPLHSFSSQKIHFIITLIGLCRSKDALTAILGLSVNGEHVDVAAHPTITQLLVGIAEALLNPLLHSKFPSLYGENRAVTDAIRKLGGREKGYDVPIETIEDLLSDDDEGPGVVVRQILIVLGPNARASIRLLQALCRILKGRRDRHAVCIMKQVVLPAASMVQTNVALSDAIWGVLKDWPHSLRWDLYEHLDKVVCMTCPAYRVVSNRASYETRYILKRLTADNQKQHTLTMAKITHGQALAAFSTTLDRIQGYPADVVTISPVVEACRRCTDLSIDVLLYLVLSRMADARRSRLKQDGINTAQWYATLSLFLGLCLRKLSVAPQHTDAVLHFLHSKLVEDDEPLLIIALSDIIKCVADIEVDINLSAKQIASHGGGPVLLDVVSTTWSKVQPDPQMCGTITHFRTERERNSATSALLECFQRTGVHSYVAVAIAQLTRDAIYHESIRTMPLKLGANIVDMARKSLFQLSQFMDTKFSDSKRDSEFRELIWKPLRSVGIGEMVRSMKVPASSAVSLMAPKLDCIAELELVHPEASSRDSLPKELAEQKKDLSLNTESHTSGAADGPSRGAADGPSRGPDSHQVKQDTAEKTAGWHSEDEVISSQSEIQLAEIIQNKVHGTISKSFLTAFWFGKLSDIAVPVDIYEIEQKKFASIQTIWETELEACRSRAHGDTDRSRRVDLELRRIREYVQKLETERNIVTKRLGSVLKVFENRKEDLRAGGDKESPSERLTATYFFLQECVLPRCKLSRPDALFCSKFVQLLLTLDLPAICFPEYYQVLMQLVPIVIRGCSENESLCFSFLIKETLVTLESWRSNRNTFETHASTGKKHGLRAATSPTKGVPMKHWQFCQWLFGIHESLTNGLSAVLRSDEYLYARNSLSLLNAVADVFPKVSEHCSEVEKCVEILTKSDLADVRLTSTGVLARLRAGKAKRLPKHVFTLKPVGGGGSQTVKGAVKRTPSPREQEAVRESASPPASSDQSKNVMKQPDGMPTQVARSSSDPDIGPQNALQVSNLGRANKGLSSRNQEKYNHPIPVVGSCSNEDVAGRVPVESSKMETQKALNPNAKEFIPSVKREGAIGLHGKRPRSSDGELQIGTVPPKDEVRLTGDGRNNPSSEMAPPLKKARGEDTSKRNDREPKPPAGSKRNSSVVRGQVPDKPPLKREGHLLERGKLAPTEGDSVKVAGGRSGDRHQEPESISKKQPGSLDTTEKSGALGFSIGDNGDKPTIPAPVITAREGGRSPSRGRSGSPGRKDQGMRQSFPNGREYGHGKSNTGERYRDGGSRSMRRDVLGGTAGPGRDGIREGPARDHGGVRRREGGGYDYSGGGDRRSTIPAGDFRRSSSESRLREGSGPGDYVQGHEYGGDGHATKRRRDGGPIRGSYGYEGDGRRPPRPRNDGDRMRDEGKIGSDRRFNGNSPARDSGGAAHNPNWMDGRRHGDGHEGTRRQNEEDHVGWQKRGERDFDGGSRGARRDEYYERPERYGEGPPRRDDRRRSSRGRPVRRRMGGR